MTPLEMLRAILARTITFDDTAEWPGWMYFPAKDLEEIADFAFRKREEAWCEAVLTVLDDPGTEVICVTSVYILSPNRFTTRLLKHPKVLLKYEYWFDIMVRSTINKGYTDAIVLVSPERVVLPNYSMDDRYGGVLFHNRKQQDLVVKILAHLVPWRLPATHPDYQKITKLVEKARAHDSSGPVPGMERTLRSHPYLFGRRMAAFKYLSSHLVSFVVTVNTRPDLGVGDFGPR